MPLDQTRSGIVGTTSSRRRRLFRLAALATATTMAVGAYTATASATDAPSAPPAAGLHLTTPKAPSVARSALGASKSTHKKSVARSQAVGSGWVVPSQLVFQGWSGEVDSQTFGSSAVDHTYLPSGTPQFRSVLDIGDLNGDKADEILTISASGHLQLVYGNGDGITQLGAGWQIYNQVTVAGDINGDGHADLLARDTTGHMWYYPSTGNANAPFGARKALGAGWNVYDQIVGVTGFDGTSATSLVTRDLTGGLWVYDLKSDGTGAARKKIGTSWNVYNQIVSVDVDGDGRSDLVGRTVPGVLNAYISNGSGGMAAAQNIGSKWYGLNLFANQGGAASWGKEEVVARTPAGGLYFYGVYGNGTLAAATPYPKAGATPAVFPVLNDAVSLDDNGFGNLLGGTAAYKASPGYAATSGDLVNLNTGVTLEANVGYDRIIGLGDVTNDGKSDLLARDKAGKLWLVPGNGAQGVANRVSLGAGWNMFNRIIGAGDTTGDGLPDILATTPAGGLYLYPGKSGGGFSARIYLGAGWSGMTKIASPGDMTGDGKADLIAVDSAGNLWDYASIGGGKFAARVKIWAGGWNAYTDVN